MIAPGAELTEGGTLRPGAVLALSDTGRASYCERCIGPLLKPPHGSRDDPAPGSPILPIMEDSKPPNPTCSHCGRPLTQQEWFSHTELEGIRTVGFSDECLWPTTMSVPHPTDFALVPICPDCEGSGVVHEIPYPARDAADYERLLLVYLESERPCPKCGSTPPPTGA
jgi:hypothetical protein